MNEFLTLAALIVLAATGTGLLIAGVAHYALTTDPAHGGRPTAPPAAGREGRRTE